LTLNIASSYAELFRTLERKVKERTADLQASKAELEKSGEYKTRFFANISHEFRTPLTIAQGLVDRISQKRVADVLLQQELQPVKRNMTRLSDMVNQIVDLTKTDNNQLTLHPRNYYGDAVVSIALESFRSLAEYRKQNLTFTADSPRTVVYVDRPKMEIMINNLISNAIKYTPEGGHIDVQTREAGGLYQVIVTDNGRGIPPEEQDAIFERFHRIKQNAEHYVEGMGIGLELSRSLARLHNGDIQLDKTRTEGSRFILILPVSTNTEPVQVEESFFEKDLLEIPETAPANHSFSILLAEDNDDMAGYVSGILSEIGVVTRVRNGVEALAALANTIPDLVITDLMMPEMDGMKLVSQMQKTIAYRKIPVVVLSARALEQDRLDLLRIGVVDYITKPFIAAELLLKTRNLLVLAENRQKAEIVLTTDERALELEKLAPQAAAYVQKHLKDATLSIDLVADHLGISRRTFYRIIEAETGMTGAEFIREVRLQAARSLLTQETTWTLETLSNEVGYASARNFKKLYSERFGAAPTV
jgi:CheY-like chemotaxis protein/nitrogen-specific signal transduction histidine kinase